VETKRIMLISILEAHSVILLPLNYTLYFIMILLSIYIQLDWEQVFTTY